ncbi:EAL domain-containing protein [Neorhizobium sp. NCHU2750]|uniref:putative bifunctional diguanylate cyclase/phosphodiesterase n=1 Tax=Neorhizobium sp. NCHU2750 TaxID=1825976 RepID=UPI000E76BD1D|nr:diguanylate cyclase [Neorhizobium sp. NCHU2750]
MKFRPPHRLSWQSIIAPNPISLLIALSISLCIVAIAFNLDRRNTDASRAALRENVENTASSMSHRLAWHLKGDIKDTEILAHELFHETNISPDHLRQLIGLIFESHGHFSAVAIAPGLQISQIQTPTGLLKPGEPSPFNIEHLRTDLGKAARMSEPFLLTGSQENHITLIVPMKPEDGGSLTTRDALAVIIDKTALLRAAGMMLDGDRPKENLTDLSWTNFSLRDASRPEYLPFLGDDGVDGKSALTKTIDVAGSRWELAMAPKNGWEVTPSNQRNFRLLLALGALGVIGPILVATGLLSERNRNIAELKMREANLVDLSQRFNLAMDASNIGIWEVAGDGVQLFLDRRARALHGASSRQEMQKLKDLLGLVMPEDRAKAEAHLLRWAQLYEPCSETYRVALSDGTVRHLRSAGARYENIDGSQRMTGIVWDATADMLMAQTLRDAKTDADVKNAELELALDELSNRERELEELSSRLDLALASYGCGIWEYSPALGVETWDARMCQLYGVPFTNGIMTQERWLNLILPEDRPIAINASRTYLGGNTREALVVRVPQPDGSTRYIRSVGQLHISKDGSKKLIGLAFDVTKDAILTVELQKAKTEADAKNSELELAKSRIEHNALHDPLTLLANRRKLDLELDALSRAGGRQKFALLHLDLDRFKQINDTLGHAAGDAMLVHASRILTQNVEDGDLVARIGGDEFVILVHGRSSQAELARLAERIISDFRLPVDFEGFSCRCGVSIGIAEANGFHVDARRILVNADLALYRAKGLGRNRSEFFTQNLHAEIIDHKRTADELLSAIDNHEFVAWYQPQVCAETNILTGVEALIRWNHPRRGILTPDHFLKIADDINVSATLDQIVLETALKDKMRWTAQGIVIPRVSVNVSAKRLHDTNLIEMLRGLQISPGEIAFELVESIFLDDSDTSVVDNLEKIKELGIDVEIDDFGTGHTSIVSLLKLRPKRLKIDKQLVQPILGAPQERALVRSIVDIARSLGVETVAEGVETFDHARLLRELGCDVLQGYAFARPLPFEQLAEAARKGWKQPAA